MKESVELENWLEQMRQAPAPGPAVCVIVYRGGSPLQWKIDLKPEADLGAVVDGIDDSLRHEVVFACELHAFNAKGQLVDKCQYDKSHERTAQIMPVQTTSMISARVEDTVDYALRSSRSFAGLGFKAVIQSYDMVRSIVARLEKENVSLREENAELRRRITSTWELESRLRGDDAERKAGAEQAVRNARLAETFLSGFMAKHFGYQTPEGRAPMNNIAADLLESIDAEQLSQIVPLLKPEQQTQLAVLIRTTIEAKNQKVEAPPKTMQQAAADAAAANAERARGD